MVISGVWGSEAQDDMFWILWAWGLGFRGLKVWGLGFRGLGVKGLGFRGLPQSHTDSFRVCSPSLSPSPNFAINILNPQCQP